MFTRKSIHPALQSAAHRPWPLPRREWKWRQSWLDLAFIHYRAEAAALRSLLPPGLKLQEFDGSAWVALVPFRMAGVMRRPLPNLPPFSSFLELNLRTYVEFERKAGVWFFSLDANNWPVVLGGRWIYGLQYYFARMQHRLADGWHFFSSLRRSGNARFDARYRSAGEAFFPAHGSFEHWAAERYCLYSHSDRRGIERVEVHHAPWPIQRANVEINTCTILSSAGITPLNPQPICHFSTGVHVVSFPKEKVNPIHQASAPAARGPQATGYAA